MTALGMVDLNFLSQLDDRRSFIKNVSSSTKRIEQEKLFFSKTQKMRLVELLINKSKAWVDCENPPE